MSRYQFIEQVVTTELVQVLCRVLQVSPAGYYQWLCLAQLAASPGPSRAEHPAAAPAYHGGRPSGHRSQEPAA